MPLEIVTGMLSPHPDRPGVQAPAMELHTEWEFQAAAEVARAHGWRDHVQPTLER